MTFCCMLLCCEPQSTRWWCVPWIAALSLPPARRAGRCRKMTRTANFKQTVFFINVELHQRRSKWSHYSVCVTGSFVQTHGVNILLVVVYFTWISFTIRRVWFKWKWQTWVLCFCLNPNCCQNLNKLHKQSLKCCSYYSILQQINTTTLLVFGICSIDVCINGFSLDWFLCAIDQNESEAISALSGPTLCRQLIHYLLISFYVLSLQMHFSKSSLTSNSGDNGKIMALSLVMILQLNPKVVLTK